MKPILGMTEEEFEAADLYHIDGTKVRREDVILDPVNYGIISADAWAEGEA